MLLLTSISLVSCSADEFSESDAFNTSADDTGDPEGPIKPPPPPPPVHPGTGTGG